MTKESLVFFEFGHHIHPMEINGYIHSLSCAVPEFKVNQTDTLNTLTKVFDLNALEQSRIGRIFENTGIKERHMSAPLSWYTEPQSWFSKNKIYKDTSLKLLKNVASQALKKANWLAQEVDHILVISTTGIATPSLDAHLMNEMPFRQNITRTPIFGLGCAGGLTGINRAGSMAKAFPGSKVLLLVVELCSLSFQKDKLDKKSLVAAALFADGAAAVTISTDPSDVKILDGTERTWPDTLDIMGWDVEDSGFSVVFSKSIPDLVSEKMKPFTNDFLSNNKVSLNQINKCVSHPGGAKVVDALEHCFELKSGEMIESREVLLNYGNMSSPTILFALERALASREKFARKEKWLLSSLGPGFTGVLGLLEV